MWRAILNDFNRVLQLRRVLCETAHLLAFLFWFRSPVCRELLATDVYMIGCGHNFWYEGRAYVVSFRLDFRLHRGICLNMIRCEVLLFLLDTWSEHYCEPWVHLSDAWSWLE